MKLIVLDINNLTDARYFAAWNADFLSLNIDPTADKFVRPEYFHALQEWIEGPEFMFMPGRDQMSDLDAVLKLYTEEPLLLLTGAQAQEKKYPYYQRIQVPLQSSINGIGSTLDKNASGILMDLTESGVTWNDIKQNKLGAYNEWKKLCAEFPIFIHLDLNAADLEEIISLGIEGICLTGGEEERVGVKSFDELDSIFERLEEIKLESEN